VSADLLYGLTLRLENDAPLVSPGRVLKQLSTAARIRETGPGEGIVPAQPLPSTSVAAFENLTLPYLENIGRTDSEIGRDLRGRLPSEDLHNLINSVRAKYVAPDAETEKLDKEFYQRGQYIATYWSLVRPLMHSRDMWTSFLARNHRSLHTPHGSEVIAAEKSLVDALQNGGPNAERFTLTHNLMDAYVRERSERVASVPLSDADYHARLAPCPAPGIEMSGSDRVKIGAQKRSPEEFYPDQSKHLLEEGSVVLSVRVSATGCATDIGVAGSSGSTQLDDAAQRYAETMEFLPAEQAGTAIAATKEFKVTFKLSDR
jgi:TonB family protein